MALLGLILGLLGVIWSLLGSRRPPAPELDFRCILGVMLAPLRDPPDLKKQGFRVDDVAFFENQGVRKTPKTPPKKAWLSRNGKRVRSESRKHRK